MFCLSGRQINRTSGLQHVVYKTFFTKLRKILFVSISILNQMYYSITFTIKTIIEIRSGHARQ